MVQHVTVYLLQSAGKPACALLASQYYFVILAIVSLS